MTCCDLHNRNCEPPSELCCGDCTEGVHPNHADGSTCVMVTCFETYRSRVTYSPPTFNTVTCLRTDLDELGRHRGQHYGWEQMPAGERTAHRPDPDKPGWSKPTTEPYPAWCRLWTWDQGGAHGSSSRQGENPVTCPECGTLHYVEAKLLPVEATLYTGAPDAYAVAGEDPVACFHCRLWAERIVAHTAGWQRRGPRDPRLNRSIRLLLTNGKPSGRLNAWADGVTGAFGDRKVTVRWDDGDQRGPASSMWDCGRIPWWLDDQFPTNAVVVGGGW